MCVTLYDYNSYVNRILYMCGYVGFGDSTIVGDLKKYS